MPELPFDLNVQIVALLASPIHRYEGRPTDGPLPVEGPESRESIEIRAGLGIAGDRFFNQAAHRSASVTVMAIESLEAVARELELSAVPDPANTRRNILLRGADIDDLAGEFFSLDSGSGAIEFSANRPANPCAWMDQMVAPGAFRALARRGGMRCSPLGDGTLRLGPAVLRTSIEISV